MAVKGEEKDAFVPSLCVFKNEAFLNSIFLTDPEWEENDDEEKILKLGRHPDCDIVVDHPSISRWHLQIQVQKSSQELLLTDLSSVHGTFVCGQRIVPKFPIALRVNDTFRMGASTRVYKFQLLPYPSEEEEDCPTPKLLHTVNEPNKHECSSDGNNKEQDISIKKCGQMGAAGSNSWNTTPTSSRIVSEPDETNYRSNDENEEQVSMEERHVNAVESIFRNLAPTLSDIFSEHDKQKCGRNNENKELALKRKDYFKAVESIVLSNLMEIPMLFESVSDLDKQEQEWPTIFGKNKERILKEHENVKASESASDNMSNIPIYLERSFECNKGNGSFASENNDQVLKENGNVGATALSILNSFKSVADANKQERPFNGENKEQFLKEHSHIEVIRNVEALEPVQNDTLKTPIHLKSASECNKGKGSFVRENNEQVLNEHGNAGAIQLRILDSLECVSDANKQECAFDGENKEWILEDQGHTEVIEPVQSNPVEIPIFMERVSEPKNPAYALAGENKEQVLKEHGHVEAIESVLSNRVNTRNFLESICETDKQECAFDGENKEWILEDQGHTDVIEPAQSNPVEIPIFTERISEPKNSAYALAGENKEQVLKEHEHVEAGESVLSNRVKTPNFLESISETDKQECTFIHENKEQILKEYEYVEPVESAPNDTINTLIYMKTIPEWNRGEGSFPSENKEDTLKELGHAEIIEPVKRNPVDISIFMDSVSECEKEVSADQDELAGENKEHVPKENVEPVESVPNSTINTPIYMETVPEWNRGEGSFPSENKEDALKELGHAESIEAVPTNPLETPIFMDSISECKNVVYADQDEFSVDNKEQVLKENVEAVTFVSIKQEYLSANKSKEQALEEHGFVETFEPNPINPIKTPILLESVPEPNKQECGLAFENEEHVTKKQSHCGADMLVPYNLFLWTPILSDAILGSNKQDSGFDGDVKVIESDLRNPNQIILDGIAEPIKQECEFVHKNKNQFLLEEEYVELVESVPWKPVQPSAPPLPESHSHLDGFNVVNDFGDRENKRINTGTGASNLWLRRQKDGKLICLQTGRMEMNLNPKKLKENPVKITKQKQMLKENSSSEIIPKGKNVRCDKKNKVLGEKKRDSILQVLPPEISGHGSSSTGFNPDDDDFYPSDKENCTPKVSCQTSKKAARKVGREDQNAHLLQTDTGRAPFQSLSQNSRVNNRPAISSSLKNTNRSMENHKGSLSEVQISGVVQHSNLADSKKKWLMVVDTGCLIHDESRQALKQLEGIKGTQLIIPRIVIRELDCLKRQNKSKKGKEAQEFLRWIEECMTNKGWWVHVQNSAECFSFGVTPPASPLSSLSAGNNDASASVAFSSYGSFADVLSPTAEDHILECALLYKRLANGGRVVLLSNDVALKVKAMAEGMLCENAKEFCQSLVSPYSERFLWSQSTAHGHNWTDINNISRKTLGVTRKLTYFGMMKNSLLRDEEPKKKSNEGAKGLKLILLHNSHYGQKHT